MHLFNAIEDTTPEVNPNVNHGLWVIMMCQCRFIDCNKYTTQVQGVGDGGGCVSDLCIVCEGYIVFSIHLTVHLKLL